MRSNIHVVGCTVLAAAAQYGSLPRRGGPVFLGTPPWPPRAGRVRSGLPVGHWEGPTLRPYPRCAPMIPRLPTRQTLGRRLRPTALPVTRGRVDRSGSSLPHSSADLDPRRAGGRRLVALEQNRGQGVRGKVAAPGCVRKRAEGKSAHWRGGGVLRDCPLTRRSQPPPRRISRNPRRRRVRGSRVNAQTEGA